MAINSRLTLNNQQYLAALEQASGALGRFVGESSIRMQALYRESDYLNRGLAGGIGRFANDMKSFGQNMSTYVTLPIVALGTVSIQAFAKIDSLRRGLDSMTGSTQATKVRMEELLEVSKLPGLGFEEAVQGDIRLRAVGISAKQSKDILLQFGNAIATTGGGKLELGTVLSQLTQMSSKGKVLAEDLKPILNASPLVAKAIKDMFGTVDSETISKKLKSIGASSTDFINMLVEKLSDLPRVTGGIGNAIETFGDSTKIAFATFGEGIDKSLDVTGKLNVIGEVLISVANSFKELDPAMQKGIVGFVTLAAVAGPAVLALGYLTSGTTYLATGFTFLGTAAKDSLKWIVANPYVAAGVALAALATYIYFASQKTQELTESQKALHDVTGQAQAQVITETEKVKALIDITRSEIRTKDEKLAALKKLNEISPQYFGKLSLETVQTKKAEDATKAYTDALLKNAIAKGAEAKAGELGTKLVEQKENLEAINKELNTYQKGAKTPNMVLGMGYNPANQNKVDGVLLGIKDRATEAKQSVVETENAIRSLSKYIAEAPTTPTSTTLNGGGTGTGKKSSGSVSSSAFDVYFAEDKARKKALQDAYNSLDAQIFDNESKISAKANKIWESVRTVSDDIKTIDFKLQPIEMESFFGSVTKATAKFAEFKKETSDLGNNMAEMSISISNSLRNAAADGLTSFGEFIGGMISGTMQMADLPAMLGGVLAELASSIGKAMIAFGTAALAAQLLISNPYLAIAAGVALVALSSALKGSISKSVSSATGGSAASASSYSPSSSVSASSFQQRVMTVEVIGTTKIQGNDLVVAYRNANRGYGTKR